MNQAERRQTLIYVLCLRRHDKICNLAREFGVCERTIRYDVEALSCEYPIKTERGRHNGGVWVAEEYYLHQRSSGENVLNREQIDVLNKAISCMNNNHDKEVLNGIRIQFSPRPVVP